MAPTWIVRFAALCRPQISARQSDAAVLCYDKRVTNVQATVDICTELVKRPVSSLTMRELWA